MPGLLHLGDGIRHLDKLAVRIAPGDDDALFRRAVGDGAPDRFELQIAELEHVGDLVEHHQIDVGIGEHPLGFPPHF